MCSAILSKEGYCVRILEKHTVAGGGLHTFKRQGTEFETGMHLISGFQPNGVLNKLFSYIGVADKLHIKPANDDGFDHFHVVADGVTYKMARGRDNFVKTHISRKKGKILNVISTRFMRFVIIFPFLICVCCRQIMGSMETSVSELTASCTSNSKLQNVLAWNNVMYGGRKNKIPAYVGALMTQFYIERASRFIGGSQHLADALVGLEKLLKNI